MEHNPDGKLQKRRYIFPGEQPHIAGFSKFEMSQADTVPFHEHPTMDEYFLVVEGHVIFSQQGHGVGQSGEEGFLLRDAWSDTRSTCFLMLIAMRHPTSR